MLVDSDEDGASNELAVGTYYFYVQLRGHVDATRLNGQCMLPGDLTRMCGIGCFSFHLPLHVWSGYRPDLDFEHEMAHFELVEHTYGEQVHGIGRLSIIFT